MCLHFKSWDWFETEHRRITYPDPTVPTKEGLMHDYPIDAIRRCKKCGKYQVAREYDKDHNYFTHMTEIGFHWFDPPKGMVPILDKIYRINNRHKTERQIHGLPTEHVLKEVSKLFCDKTREPPCHLEPSEELCGKCELNGKKTMEEKP